jgi:hypothetical protein
MIGSHVEILGLDKPKTITARQEGRSLRKFFVNAHICVRPKRVYLIDGCRRRGWGIGEEAASGAKELERSAEIVGRGGMRLVMGAGLLDLPHPGGRHSRDFAVFLLWRTIPAWILWRKENKR